MTYTHGHHESALRSHRWRTVANSAAYLAGRLVPGMSLLDVGCGPGTITVDFGRRLAPGRVVGVDAGAPVLAEARRAAADADVSNVDFLAGGAVALPFRDSAFDVVHMHQVLHHIADPVAALREMRRVCRPGGLVAVRETDWAVMAWYPAVPELDEWLALVRQVLRDGGGEPDAGRRLLSWARQAGFTDITAGASTWCFATPEERAWWAGSWADRMLHSQTAHQARRYASEADLARISAAWSAWGAAPDGWFTVVHGEILCVA